MSSDCLAVIVLTKVYAFLESFSVLTDSTSDPLFG
jgi:hypothetical protein